MNLNDVRYMDDPTKTVIPISAGPEDGDDGGGGDGGDDSGDYEDEAAEEQSEDHDDRGSDPDPNG
jgi:hypothetical protein